MCTLPLRKTKLRPVVGEGQGGIGHEQEAGIPERPQGPDQLGDAAASAGPLSQRLSTGTGRASQAATVSFGMGSGTAPPVASNLSQASRSRHGLCAGQHISGSIIHPPRSTASGHGRGRGRSCCAWHKRHANAPGADRTARARPMDDTDVDRHRSHRPADRPW